MLLSLLISCATPPEDTGPGSLDGPPCLTGELLDGEVCVPEACGLGPWGNLELADGTVYVDGQSDGDGSADAPFRSIQQGADAAGQQGGGTVAIAEGTYFENLLLDSRHVGVDLVGRCPELVVVDGSAGLEGDTTIEVAQNGIAVPVVGLSGMTVRGGRGPGFMFGMAPSSPQPRSSSAKTPTMASVRSNWAPPSPSPTPSSKTHSQTQRASVGTASPSRRHT